MSMMLMSMMLMSMMLMSMMLMSMMLMSMMRRNAPIASPSPARSPPLAARRATRTQRARFLLLSSSGPAGVASAES